jgi:hypothetical protein
MEADPLDDWRTTPPSAAAADQIRTWLDARILEIRRDDIGHARNALEDPGWRIHIDIAGVPLNALARIDTLLETACDALADRDLDPDTAIRALQDAIGIVTGNGEA